MTAKQDAERAIVAKHAPMFAKALGNANARASVAERYAAFGRAAEPVLRELSHLPNHVFADLIREALALLDGRKIGMAVCDVNMPRMNGIEFVKAAKALPAYRFLPILMLTTESQESKKDEGRAAGAKAWMLKPFSPASLLNAVSKLCLP